MAGGSLRDLDRFALDAAQSVSAPSLDVVSSIIGLLGQAEITFAVALAIAIVRRRHGRPDWLVPFAVVAVVVIEAALKILVPQAPPPHERARTVALLPFLHAPFPFSFPSGHVARTAFLLRVANGIPAWVVVVGLALMVLSRVYLAEHWLSDTLGGLVLGLGVASVARRLSRPIAAP